MDNLQKRVLKEFEEKAKCVTMDSVKKIAIYGCIVTYLQEENISEEYAKHLMEQENVLDYLYKAYEENRHNYYEDIKAALNLDQIL